MFRVNNKDTFPTGKEQYPAKIGKPLGEYLTLQRCSEFNLIQFSASEEGPP